MPVSWLSPLSAAAAHFLLLSAHSHPLPRSHLFRVASPLLSHTLPSPSSAFSLLSGSQANHPTAAWLSPSGPWPLYPKQREAADCPWPRYVSASAHFFSLPGVSSGGRLLDAGTLFLPYEPSEMRVYLVITQYGRLSCVGEWVMSGKMKRSETLINSKPGFLPYSESLGCFTVN